MANEAARTISLKADSNKEFFLIHGYTGSPTDFNHLPEYLNKEFNANVKILRIVGHGTKIEDLDEVTYQNIFDQLSTELEKDLKKGRVIVVGGISLGALLATTLASHYPVRGVFSICPSYKLKFPFNIPGLSGLGKFKKYWKKRRKPIEYKMRENRSFSYTHMHINGLRMVKEAKKHLKSNCHKLICPILIVHARKDPISHHKSANHIHKRIKTKIKRSAILEGDIHNLFYSTENKKTYKLITQFVRENKLFDISKKERVAAIVPAYNEAERIGGVLKVLTSTKCLDEIIVVDDGSTDQTEKVIRQFKKVKYLKNKTNQGKAHSMDRGVKSTDAEIIFFCDADLINLTPKIVEEIIKPVTENKVDMFIGLRNNFMQSAVHLFAINSGERALRREIWLNLPQYFKYRYRVEAGLNHYVTRYGRGFDYKTFNYHQPTKEKKYGFLKGTFLRWWMNLDVGIAYARALFD
jgi:esterase/lipase